MVPTGHEALAVRWATEGERNVDVAIRQRKAGETGRPPSQGSQGSCRRSFSKQTSNARQLDEARLPATTIWLYFCRMSAPAKTIPTNTSSLVLRKGKFDLVKSFGPDDLIEEITTTGIAVIPG